MHTIRIHSLTIRRAGASLTDFPFELVEHLVVAVEPLIAVDCKTPKLHWSSHWISFLYNHFPLVAVLETFKFRRVLGFPSFRLALVLGCPHASFCGWTKHVNTLPAPILNRQHSGQDQQLSTSCERHNSLVRKLTIRNNVGESSQRLAPNVL